MNRRFAHYSKKQLENIRDTPAKSDSGNSHTIENNPTQDQVDAVAELEQRKLEENQQRMQSDIQKLTQPHWTLVPIFWITLAALIMAVLQFFLR